MSERTKAYLITYGLWVFVGGFIVAGLFIFFSDKPTEIETKVENAIEVQEEKHEALPVVDYKG